MKFLIFSDIHGAADSARFIVKKCEEERPDKVLILGDILYHGPRNDVPPCYEPKAVISELSRIKDMIIAVRGNCEAEVDQMVLPFPVMSEEALVFADGNTILMTHGHIHTPEKHPGGIDTFLSGHTHIPVLERKDGIIYLNPGSVSIPKGGFLPSYAVWEYPEARIISLIDGKTIFRLSLEG